MSVTVCCFCVVFCVSMCKLCVDLMSDRSMIRSNRAVNLYWCWPPVCKDVIRRERTDTAAQPQQDTQLLCCMTDELWRKSLTLISPSGELYCFSFCYWLGRSGAWFQECSSVLLNIETQSLCHWSGASQSWESEQYQIQNAFAVENKTSHHSYWIYPKFTDIYQK